MPSCEICGDHTAYLSYTCNYCDQTLCSDHRLPEAHDCPGLMVSDAGGGGHTQGDGFRAVAGRGTNIVRQVLRWILAPFVFIFQVVSGLARGLWAWKGTILSVGIIALVAVSLTVGTGVPAIDSRIGGVANNSSELLPNTSNTTNFVEGEPLERAAVETAIHREINERRQQHGRGSLRRDAQLREIARYHSTDMANNSYFAHTSPDGETRGDRYDRFGYDCRAQVSDNRYATGAENIAYTYYREDVVGPNGREVYYSNASQLATGLVNGWMNSTGHRENILKPYWNAEGIGVAIVETEEGTRVYATQNFC